jgi:hypothetical protein
MKEKKQRHNKKLNKKIYGIAILITICIIISIIIIQVNKKSKDMDDTQSEEGIELYDTSLSEYVKETDDGIKLNTSTLINSDKILDNLTITNIQLTSSAGITSLIADVTNNSDTETAITTITATLVDENGKQLCNVKGVIRALGVGETGKLNISMSGNFVTAYDIKFSK